MCSAKPLQLRTITAWITSVIPSTSSSTPKTTTDASVAMKAELIARKPTMIDTRPKAKNNHQAGRKLARSSYGGPAEDIGNGSLTVSRSLCEGNVMDLKGRAECGGV